MFSVKLIVRCLLLLLPIALPLYCTEEPEQVRSIRITRVTRAPKLDDFLSNTPREAEVKITDFRQIDPGDGDPVSQPTTAYLSYDSDNLYAAFVCVDDPKQIRSQITRRDLLFTNDRVSLSLDTFHDHRRNYWFEANAHGVQMDGTNTGGVDDLNFDTLWYSEGRITSNGYVVLMTIPFKSLRFPNAPKQTWGILIARAIQRNNEYSNWPYITWRKMPSWAGQFGDLEGLENISPSRNIQLIPYGMFSRARYLDNPALGLDYRTQNDKRAGLDAKLILNNALTLDMTVNPDFSQVESDSPQVTVNQRYEVYFPEKRPFFMENSDYFQTPENLFFSRRIVDPQVGLRLTGKVGGWGIAALAVDDRAQGKLAPEDSRLHDERAGIGVFRLYRELGKESRMGLLFASRDFGPSSNRVLAFDTRLNFRKNWTFTGQMMGSKTHGLDGSRQEGTAARLKLSESGRHFNFGSYYQDRSPDFDTQLGFIQRVGIREFGQNFGYSWRPEQSRLVRYGPSLNYSVTWDHRGQLTDWQVNPSFMVEVTHQTNLTVGRTESFERFAGIDFRKSSNSINLYSEWYRWLHVSWSMGNGDSINYYPAFGFQPFLGKSVDGSLSVTLQPGSRLRLDETYLYSRLSRGGPNATTIFNNHILRSKANYQFSRELSLRAIVDYNSILPNSSLVFMEKTKRLGFDLLLTYMLNPGTALHLGYTDNYENLHQNLLESPNLRRSGFPDTSAGRQIFVKLSYLLRI
jgi:hypothetical protein